MNYLQQVPQPVWGESEVSKRSSSCSSETKTPLDIFHNSLDGASARRKVSAYTTQRWAHVNTPNRVQIRDPSLQVALDSVANIFIYILDLFDSMRIRSWKVCKIGTGEIWSGFYCK
jgi:hypothetical protein